MKSTKLFLVVIRDRFFLTSHRHLSFRRLHFPLAIDTKLWGKTHKLLLVVYLFFLYWDTLHILTFHCWWNLSGHSVFYLFTDSRLNSGNFPLAEMKSPKQISLWPCAKTYNGTQPICMSKCSICPHWPFIKKLLRYNFKCGNATHYQLSVSTWSLRNKWSLRNMKNTILHILHIKPDRFHSESLL